mmetsp:Transcript_21077/g.20228  ORF Transcript_21077/g.20228 Transcript_21077/m.20228 type:complete len:82 (-) Transcript_21077:697-942(-)
MIFLVFQELSEGSPGLLFLSLLLSHFRLEGQFFAFSFHVHELLLLFQLHLLLLPLLGIFQESGHTVLSLLGGQRTLLASVM